MARFQISQSVEIDKPAETVYQFVTDLSKTNLWRPNVVNKDISEDSLSVGMTWVEASKFLGREVEVKNEVRELEAGRHCRIKIEGGVVSGENTWEFQPISESQCITTLSFEGEISGWLASLAGGVLRNQAGSNMKKDLASLKSNLETG